MSFASRKAAVRAHYEANAPVALDRIDRVALNGPPTFKPPKLPDLTGLSGAAKLAALQSAVWIRVSFHTVPKSGRPLHLGAWSPTETKAAVHQQIFAPAGYGEDFLLPILDAARAVFHRQHLLGGDIRFHDSEDPITVTPEADGSKWAQFNVVTPCTSSDEVAA